jgi:hypothetical protein
MYKKSIAFAALLTLGMSLGASAADEWFTRYDKDHDQRWTWHEFRDAHHNWCHNHHGAAGCWNDHELRQKFEAMAGANRTWVSADQVREFHSW